MPYLWIFLGCYCLMFVITTLRMSSEQARMESRIKAIGGSVDKLRANFRAEMPLWQDILIRLWSPLVLSIVPTALLSLGYFVFN